MRIKKQINRYLWLLKNTRKILKGFQFAHKWESKPLNSADSTSNLDTSDDNSLRSFFNNHSTGFGLMKWNHYFDAYHNHFKKFIGKEVHILEIGVHSGGSLEMWKKYFGPKCSVYGIDIEQDCKIHESKEEKIKIFIGDQGDRDFWKSIKKQVPKIDIIIDDGSHNTDHQIITLEEMLPHIQPGGIFVCEDIKRILNGFAMYMFGLTAALNALVHDKSKKKSNSEKSIARKTLFQREIASIHTYPFIVFVEKNKYIGDRLKELKRGTLWQTYFSHKEKGKKFKKKKKE